MVQLQQAAEDAGVNLRSQQWLSAEMAVDIEPDREGRLRRIPRDAVETGQ